MAGIWEMTDTWTDGGVTYRGVNMDVSDVNSAAGSRLLELQVGSVAQWSIDPSGLLDVGRIRRSKSITVEDPQTADLLAFWLTDQALTATAVSYSIVGGTSVAFTVGAGSGIGGGTAIHTATASGTVFSEAVTGTAGVAADQAIYLDLTTVTGAVTQFVLTLHFEG